MSGDRGCGRVFCLRGAAGGFKISSQVGCLHIIGRASRHGVGAEVVVRAGKDQTAMAIGTVEQRKAAGRIDAGPQNGFASCISSNLEFIGVLQQVLVKWITFFGLVCPSNLHKQ